jgi:hypothetical protein
MMIYCAARFKPKKKRAAKGVIAKKYSKSSAILGVEKLPSLAYGSRVGADSARSIQSLDTNLLNTQRKESMKYTGTLVKGIAVTHKSNLIPITSKEQAEEVARMRR